MNWVVKMSDRALSGRPPHLSVFHKKVSLMWAIWCLAMSGRSTFQLRRDQSYNMQMWTAQAELLGLELHLRFTVERCPNPWSSTYLPKNLKLQNPMGQPVSIPVGPLLQREKLLLFGHNHHRWRQNAAPFLSPHFKYLSEYLQNYKTWIFN